MPSGAVKATPTPGPTIETDIPLPTDPYDGTEGVYLSDEETYIIMSEEPGVPFYNTDEQRIYLDGIVYRIIAGRDLSIVDFYDPGFTELAFSGTFELFGVQCTVKEIETEAFFYYAGLESIILPDTIETIGVNAFYGCDEVTNLKLSANLKKIGNGAFYGCAGLTAIDLPDGLTSVGDEAFCSMSLLESINFPDSVTSLGFDMFYGCESLVSAKLPSGLTMIPSGLFYGCENLATLTLPAELREMGAEAFYYCSALTSVVLPEGFRTIGEDAFSFSGLTEITFPDSFDLPEDDTFLDYCTELEYVNVSESRYNEFVRFFEEADFEVRQR
jgi:hypothetical protein